MTNNSATVETVVDAGGSSVLLWGDNDPETVGFNEQVLTAIQEISQTARVATDYAADLATFHADLRGQATMLGLTIPANVDIFGALRSYLLASRDHEGELGEVFARQGDSTASRPHSARRGWLDSTAYEMDRAADALAELKAYEDKQAAR